MRQESLRIPAWDLTFSLFLRPISPHDVRLYALRDEIECSERFYLSRKKAKKRRPKKRIRIWFGLLYGTNCIKADEILSDFSEEIIIRFFYRRKSPLPYNCTATWRFSTLLHLFYLSPFRCGRNPYGFLHEIWRFRFFCARFRRTTCDCTPCATKSSAPNDFIYPAKRLKSADRKSG